MADGGNFNVHILDRDSLEVLAEFGEGGWQPGLFFALHSIVTDSDGNIYTTEPYEGKRIQKFLMQGMRPVTEHRPGAPGPDGEIH